MAVYDKVDWHLDSALEAGQPPEHAATHIGLFLGWLARRELLDTSDLDPAEVEAVRRGEIPGSALLESFDDKLISVAMSFEGDAFAAARYTAYTDAYDTVFADRPAYSVADDAATAEIVAPILDDLYESWVHAGRPGSSVDRSERRVDDDVAADSATARGTMFVPEGVSPDLHEYLKNHARDLGLSIATMPPPRRHHSELAGLVPDDLADPPIEFTELGATTERRTSRLRRALDELGVEARDVTFAVGVGGGPGPSTLAISLYRVPGVDAARLAASFESVIFKPARSSWMHVLIADREVRWVDTPDFSNAFWARDGLVIHVGGAPPELERVIPRLP